MLVEVEQREDVLRLPKLSGCTRRHLQVNNSHHQLAPDSHVWNFFSVSILSDIFGHVEYCFQCFLLNFTQR